MAFQESLRFRCLFELFSFFKGIAVGSTRNNSDNVNRYTGKVSGGHSMIEYKSSVLCSNLKATYGPLPIYASLTYIFFPVHQIRTFVQRRFWALDFSPLQWLLHDHPLSLSLLHNLSQTQLVEASSPAPPNILRNTWLAVKHQV